MCSPRLVLDDRAHAAVDAITNLSAWLTVCVRLPFVPPTVWMTFLLEASPTYSPCTLWHARTHAHNHVRLRATASSRNTCLPRPVYVTATMRTILGLHAHCSTRSYTRRRPAGVS